MRVAAVRAALDLMRAGGARNGGDVEPDDLASDESSPELDYVKERYAPQFKAAFQDALRALDSEQRNVLRLHVVEGLNIDEIGALFRVHRSTVARWIAGARQAGAGGRTPAAARRARDLRRRVRLAGRRRAQRARPQRRQDPRQVAPIELFLRQPATGSVFSTRGGNMERKSGKAMKITFGLVGAGLLTAGMLSSATGAHRGGRAALTVDTATRALVYGGADAAWTERAAALVAADGEAARAIGHVAEAANVDAAARARALDALGRAGSVEAQQAMRHALSSPTFRGDPAYPLLVARLSSLSTPTLRHARLPGAAARHRHRRRAARARRGGLPGVSPLAPRARRRVARAQTVTTMEEANEGMQFGPYLLRRRLCTGGMASVWTATDGDGRALVVKRILPSLAADDELVAMFDREATLSARLSHPNIVRVLDHGAYEGERYLAMELLHGRDLSTVMAELVKQGAPSPGLGAFVGLQAARALAYVHALCGDDGAPLHLVHRDISLSNVMLGFDGSVKLLDFGVAKALAVELTQRTQVGVLKGKWAYLAPEQLDGDDVDQRADIFALGIVLWEMLTGRRLFKAATGLQTLEKVRAAHVLPPSTINPAVPPALDAIVLKALAKAPCERFATAAKLADALERVVAALGCREPALASQMATLFADDSETLPMARIALDPTAPDDVAAATAEGGAAWVSGEMLSPQGATLSSLRRRPSFVRGLRARAWRMLIAAALAALLGGYTGWQISLLHAARLP